MLPPLSNPYVARVFTALLAPLYRELYSHPGRVTKSIFKERVVGVLADREAAPRLQEALGLRADYIDALLQPYRENPTLLSVRMDEWHRNIIKLHIAPTIPPREWGTRNDPLIVNFVLPRAYNLVTTEDLLDRQTSLRNTFLRQLQHSRISISTKEAIQRRLYALDGMLYAQLKANANIEPAEMAPLRHGNKAARKKLAAIFEASKTHLVDYRAGLCELLAEATKQPIKECQALLEAEEIEDSVRLRPHLISFMTLRGKTIGEQHVPQYAVTPSSAAESHPDIHNLIDSRMDIFSFDGNTLEDTSLLIRSAALTSIGVLNGKFLQCVGASILSRLPQGEQNRFVSAQFTAEEVEEDQQSVAGMQRNYQRFQKTVYRNVAKLIQLQVLNHPRPLDGNAQNLTELPYILHSVLSPINISWADILLRGNPDRMIVEATRKAFYRYENQIIQTASGPVKFDGIYFNEGVNVMRGNGGLLEREVVARGIYRFNRKILDYLITQNPAIAALQNFKNHLALPAEQAVLEAELTGRKTRLYQALEDIESTGERGTLLLRELRDPELPEAIRTAYQAERQELIAALTLRFPHANAGAGATADQLLALQLTLLGRTHADLQSEADRIEAELSALYRLHHESKTQRDFWHTEANTVLAALAPNSASANTLKKLIDWHLHNENRNDYYINRTGTLLQNTVNFLKKGVAGIAAALASVIFGTFGFLVHPMRGLRNFLNEDNPYAFIYNLTYNALGNRVFRFRDNAKTYRGPTLIASIAEDIGIPHHTKCKSGRDRTSSADNFRKAWKLCTLTIPGFEPLHNPRHNIELVQTFEYFCEFSASNQSNRENMPVGRLQVKSTDIAGEYPHSLVDKFATLTKKVHASGSTTSSLLASVRSPSLGRYSALESALAVLQSELLTVSRSLHQNYQHIHDTLQPDVQLIEIALDHITYIHRLLALSAIEVGDGEIQDALAEEILALYSLITKNEKVLGTIAKESFLDACAALGISPHNPVTQERLIAFRMSSQERADFQTALQTKRAGVVMSTFNTTPTALNNFKQLMINTLLKEKEAALQNSEAPPGEARLARHQRIRNTWRPCQVKIERNPDSTKMTAILFEYPDIRPGRTGYTAERVLVDERLDIDGPGKMRLTNDFYVNLDTPLAAFARLGEVAAAHRQALPPREQATVEFTIYVNEPDAGRRYQVALELYASLLEARVNEAKIAFREGDFSASDITRLQNEPLVQEAKRKAAAADAARARGPAGGG